MLGWIFRKKDAPVAVSSTPTRPGASASSAAASAASSPADGTPGAASASAAVDWPARLLQAHGDDAALLELAAAGAPFDIVQAALQGLVAEAALKQAELAFRDKDRRLFRLVKQRRSAMVAQRHARAAAARLIETARLLVDEALIPANRLAEFDRAWQALDPARLDDAQRDAFGAALARLQALIRQRGDDVLAVERWTAAARAALARLEAASAGAAEGSCDRVHLGTAATAARAVIEAAPADPAIHDLRAALDRALQAVEHVDARLALLEGLLSIGHATDVEAPAPANAEGEAAIGAAIASAPADEAADGVAAATTDTATGVGADAATDRASDSVLAARRDPEARWRDLAASTPALDAAMNRRFEQWRQARRDAERASLSRQRDAAKASARMAHNERAAADAQRLAQALERAEAALAEGHLADAEKQFAEIDALAANAGPPDALRARAEQVKADLARLKGWQRWGGGLARDELLLQAEALAAATGTEDDGRRSVRLSIKQRAEIVDDLRSRWKELDRLGGAGSAAMWRRFDDALRDARQPVEAHKAEQRAQREQNLQARQGLIEALDAVPLPLEDRDHGHAHEHEHEKERKHEPDRDRGGAGDTGADRDRRDEGHDRDDHSGGGTVRDDLRSDGTARDDAASRGAARAGRSSRGVARDDRSSDGTAGDDAPSGGVARDNRPSRGAARDDQSSGGAALDQDPSRDDDRERGNDHGRRDGRPSDDRHDTGDDRDRRGGVADEPATPDWRQVAIALDRFESDWRKLGPLEHTVPHAARAALLERQRAAVGRLAAPLAEARQCAQRVHEGLIERARALGSNAVGNSPVRQHAAQVRELQAEWQRQARAMPLGRAIEQALWTEFRAAIDAVFSARQAVFEARDSALKAQGAERLRLIERLERAADDVPTRALESMLGEVDAQWPRIGPALRDETAALESRFRDARDSLRRRIAERAQRERRASFDALLDKLALCEARERGEVEAATLTARWPTLPALPAAWEGALAARSGASSLPSSPRATPPSADVPIDDLLLQLEAALDLAATEALQQARRALKLRTMKAALEGRQRPVAALSADAMLVALLGRSGLDEAQRGRLGTIVDAMRGRA